mgnify:CR=1 FL=1|tara:strand:- start:346 stop:753 length:408 start_codon:yes stop_codon:yes gene_type:complete
MAQDFHDQSKNKGDCMIEVWTQPSVFDITFQSENPNDNLPMITIPARQWNHEMFSKDKKENVQMLSHYFIKALSDKLGFRFLFNFPLENGQLVDNFEIVLENGRRYSFFDEYEKSLNLKDMNISRWSKMYYRHTH